MLKWVFKGVSFPLAMCGASDIKWLLLLAVATLSSGCETSDHRPSAGVCISFDDRTIQEWYQMRDVLRENNAKATFFITQFDSLSNQELEMLKQLRDDGHEIGSHGAMHVLAEKYIQENSYTKYMQNEVHANTQSMKKAGFDPVSFAYPYGSSYWFTDFIIGQHYKIIRNVYPKPVEKYDLSDSYYYKWNNQKVIWAVGFDRISNLSESIIDRLMEKAANDQSVLILYGHVPSVSEHNNSYDFDINKLKYILSTAREKKLKFFRVQDLRQ
jgi:peptidoglycan/xylan/chitin deacetylase (PgdA/CDA1 family)